MANELTTTVQLSYVKNGITYNITRTKQITVSGDDIKTGTQVIGTSAENLDIGEIGTMGIFYIRNTDATNYVEIGYDTTGTFRTNSRLNAGEMGMFRNSGVTLQARANTAPVTIEVFLVEA